MMARVKEDLAVVGKNWTRLDLSEVTNLYTPSGYKRRLIKALVKDALIELRDQPVRG
jgi:hypothetical protein